MNGTKFAFEGGDPGPERLHEKEKLPVPAKFSLPVIKGNEAGDDVGAGD